MLTERTAITGFPDIISKLKLWFYDSLIYPGEGSLVILYGIVSLYPLKPPKLDDSLFRTAAEAGRPRTKKSGDPIYEIYIRTSRASQTGFRLLNPFDKNNTYMKYSFCFFFPQVRLLLAPMRSLENVSKIVSTKFQL